VFSDFKIVVLIIQIVMVMMFDHHPTPALVTYRTSLGVEQYMPPGTILSMSSQQEARANHQRDASNAYKNYN
jgi:hypothetical protein